MNIRRLVDEIYNMERRFDESQSQESQISDERERTYHKSYAHIHVESEYRYEMIHFHRI